MFRFLCDLKSHEEATYTKRPNKLDQIIRSSIIFECAMGVTNPMNQDTS